jgi:hypothetical protein
VLLFFSNSKPPLLSSLLRAPLPSLLLPLQDKHQRSLSFLKSDSRTSHLLCLFSLLLFTQEASTIASFFHSEPTMRAPPVSPLLLLLEQSNTTPAATSRTRRSAPSMPTRSCTGQDLLGTHTRPPGSSESTSCHPSALRGDARLCRGRRGPRRRCAGTRTASRRCSTGRSSRLWCGRPWMTPLPRLRDGRPPPSRTITEHRRRGTTVGRGRLGDRVGDDTRWGRRRLADDVVVGGREGRRWSGRGWGWGGRGRRRASRGRERRPP